MIMKRLVGFIGWASVIFTIIAVIFTLLTTYQFTYIKYFSGYYPIQLGICITMISWAIKFFVYEKNDTKMTYPLVCIFLAAGAIFFMLIEVF